MSPAHTSLGEVREGQPLRLSYEALSSDVLKVCSTKVCSTGHGWTRGSPPSFLSSKAGGRAFPVLTLPVPRPACLQGGALGPSHSVMQTASCHCLALFKGTAAGVLRADYVEALSVFTWSGIFHTVVTSTIPASCLAVVWKTVL